MVYPSVKQFIEIMDAFDRWEAKLRNPHLDVESTLKRATIHRYMREDMWKTVYILMTGSLPGYDNAKWFR